MNLAIFFVSALLSGTPSAAEGNGSGVRTAPAPAATAGQAPATAGNQAAGRTSDLPARRVGDG